MKRKINRMHELFGRYEGEKCRDCYHIKGGVIEYRKCEVYGCSASEATDWVLKYDACGLFNQPYEGDVPIVRLNRVTPKDDMQIDGQMNLLEVMK